MVLALIKVIIILIILGSIFYFLSVLRVLKYEKRFEPFTIASIKEKNIALFDRAYQIIWKIIHSFSKIIRKSALASNYAKHYDKYISYEEKDLKEGLDYVSAKIFITFIVFLLGFITYMIYQDNFNIALFILILIFSFFILDIILYFSFNKKRKRIEEDLLKAIIIMNNAFMSGRNMMQAIEIVKNELDGPIQDEFKKIYLDMTYGLNIQIVFNRFYERVKLDDAKYIASSLSLLNKTGGDIVKVFAMIEKSIFDKKNLKNELNSLTASSQFIFKFLIILPIIFVLIIFVLSPSYFTPLYTTPIGIIILAFIILLYILYILVIKRIMEVDM